MLCRELDDLLFVLVLFAFQQLSHRVGDILLHSVSYMHIGVHREACVGMAELIEELVRKKKLPVKALATGSGVSKKTIDRYRKYLIMAVLILRGDYPHIAEYLKFVREEDAK